MRQISLTDYFCKGLGSRIVLLNKDGSAYAGKDASALLGKLHSELR
ncbi:hypothetical protein [Neisseria meningitidis]|nr:hypothetical protein [Neisseria meningitidis]